MSNIAVLSYDYPPNDGGISRLAGATVNEIARRGCEVAVLTLISDGKKGLPRSNVRTHEVPRKGLRRDLATYRYLRQVAAGTLILTTVWNPEATLAWLARCSRVTVMAHGNEVMQYSTGNILSLKGWLRRIILGRADAVVCNSRYTERLVQDLNPEAKTIVICPAVDAPRFAEPVDVLAARARFELPADKRLVLSVSRLDAYKGHDTVLRALARLSVESRAQLHYAVAGRGPHLTELQELASELGVSDSLTWLGFVEDELLPSLYSCADLFVLCTRQDPSVRGVEGFGMVFLEAQAAGLAVLGTRAGGIPDAVVENEGGWLVPQDAVEDVETHLERLAHDVAPFREQGALGRKRVCREATWEKYVDRLLKVMESNYA